MRIKINYLLITILIIITLLNFNIITTSINEAFNICINNVLPSLIPFILFSNIIVRKNMVNNNIYTLNVLCIISGSPSNSKYLKEYLNTGIIDINNLQKLLNYLQYVNPIYILNCIGLLTLNSKKLGLIILISNITSSLILKLFIGKINFNRSTITNDSQNVIIYSIKDTVNTVLDIIGVITCFFVITTDIDIIFNVSNNYKFIYGIFEITQGVNYLKYSNLSVYFKTIISSFFISFGGLSIHIQIFGILDNKKIRYKPYLCYRIIHSIITITVTTILFYILN